MWMIDSTRASAAEPDDAWHLTTRGGIWATSLNGTVGARNVKSDVDIGFDDLIDKTAFALNPSIEISKGDWAFAFHGTFAKLDESHTFADGRGGDVDMWLGVFDFSVAYGAWRTLLGEMPLTVIPAVGAQITYLKLEFDPNNFDTVDADRTWVDPYLAGRVVLGLSEKFDWRTTALIGGFGVGSDLTWSAGTYIDWHFAKNWELNVGYRAVSWDYDQDDFTWDITMHGPWIGISHQWF